jgi:hypothetical protein
MCNINLQKKSNCIYYIQGRRQGETTEQFFPRPQV